MYKVIIILAACFLTFGASAQRIDKIQTKDGSFYNGFISEQVPGKQVMIYAENASVIFRKKEILNQRKDYYDFQQLSESSKDLIRGVCDTTALQLCAFEYRGNYYENLYIGETADSTVRVLALTPRTYIVPWKDLYKTSRLSFNDDPYGIRDVVTLKSGERLVGQIVEQEISKAMSIREQNGNIRAIDAGDVLSVMSERISEKHPLWDQTPLLDRVVFDNGTMMEGFITSRLMGQHVNMLMRYSHDPQMIPMKNIRKYQKTRNRDYKEYAPDTAKVVRLCDKDVELLCLDEKDGVYVYRDTLVHTYFTGTELMLAVKNIPHDRTLALYEFVPVDEKSGSRKKDKPEIMAIPVEANPVYETRLYEEDGFMVCDVIARKAGKYFLTVDGFSAGLNLVFVNKSENEK